MYVSPICLCVLFMWNGVEMKAWEFMLCLFVCLRISTIAYLMPEWGEHPHTQEEEKNENYQYSW